MPTRSASTKLLRFQQKTTEKLEALIGPLAAKDFPKCDFGTVPGRVERKTCTLDGHSFSVSKQELRIASEKGSLLPIQIITPGEGCKELAKPLAALALHPSSGRYANNLVSTVTEFPLHAYGLRLAREGFTVFAPCHPYYAGYTPDLARLGYQSVLMRAVWDNIRVMDFAAEERGMLPHFAVMGHSLGGVNGLLTALFDERIKCSILSAPIVPRGLEQSAFPSKSSIHDPTLAKGLLGDLIASVCPRSLYFNAPLNDPWREKDFLSEAFAAAQRAVSPLKIRWNTRLKTSNATHEFPVSFQKEALEFLKKELVEGLDRST